MKIDLILAGGKTYYLMNKESTVNVSFLNPPAMMAFAGGQVRFSDWFSDSFWLPQIREETDALLDHLFEHTNIQVHL